MSNMVDNYGVLLALFEEFRELIKPVLLDGTPDFTASAMATQYEGLQALQKRLAAIDIGDWSVESQVD